MTKEIKFDPRTKLIVILCISTLGLLIKNIIELTIILLITIIIGTFFQIDLKRSIKKVKGLLYAIIALAIIQSIFSPEGEAIFAIRDFTILSTSGLEKGLQFILRMMIIIYSATIITTSSSRELIQGFVQWGLPYDIAFMVAIGTRFLPILGEEIKDSLTAIQLRGIEINQIPIRKRISMYSYIFTPILVATISKAENLSIAIEMRGFRAYDNRTSYLTLKMSGVDYLIIIMSTIFTITYIIFYFYIGGN